MTISEAVASLTTALQAELEKEIVSLRKELEEERHLRQSLETRLLNLIQTVYTRSEMDNRLDQLKSHVLERVDTVQQAGEADVRSARRELSERLEAVSQTFTLCSKDSKANETPTLAMAEMDKKIGVVLIDFDQRLAAAHAETASVVAASVHSARDYTNGQTENIWKRMDSFKGSLERGFESIRARLDEQVHTEKLRSASQEEMRIALEQKIGMVQLDVDSFKEAVNGHMGG